MKRKLFLICVLAMVLGVCTAFAACTPETTEETGYRVTVTYDETQGSVTIGAPEEGELYDEGELVTVTVAPNTGYAVETFTVSGKEDAALTDGSYTFAVAGDTAVAVTFGKLTYSVTLNYEKAQGSVELTPPAAGDKYAYGEAVTATVTAAQGFRVQSASVNGVAAELDGNKFTFTVTEETAVAVTFVNSTKSVLDSLKGTVAFEGTRTNHDYYYDEETVSDLRTVYDMQRRAVLIEAYAGAEPERVWLFREATDKSTVQLTHDMTGALVATPYDEPFTSLFNPFNLLSESDLTETEPGVWTVNAERQYDIVMALFGYADEVETFWMYEEGGAIVRLEIALVRVSEPDWYEDYQYTFDLTVSRDNATIDADYFDKYPTLDEHRTLKSAMQKAAAAQNYTVHMESDMGEQTLYYTDKAIYIAEEDYAYGDIVRPDGNIWSYVYDAESGEFSFERIVSEGSDLTSMKGVFTFSDNNGEYYYLLKSLGNGAFCVRPADIYDSYGDVSAFFAQQVATGSEQLDLFYAPYSFSLTLEGGVLHTVELDCEDMHIVLTFTDWDKTVLPITIEDAQLEGAIDISFGGTWADEQGETVLSVTLDTVTFGEEEVEVTEAGSGYTFEADGKTYTLTKEDETLILTAGEERITLYRCDWVFYIGTFLGVDDEGEDVDVIITANAIEVMMGGTTQSATEIVFEIVVMVDDYGYAENVAQFTFMLGDVEYILQQANYGYDELILALSDEDYGIGLSRDRYEEFDSWTEYCATYAGEGYTVTIAEASITIARGETTVKIAAADIIFYRDWDNNQGKYYYQFSFIYQDKECVLEVIDNGMLLVVDSDSADYTSYYLMDTKYVVSYEGSYGTYEGSGYVFEGEDYTEVSYIVVVAADKITLQVGEGAAKTLTIVYHSVDEIFGGITGDYFVLKDAEGTTYYLSVYKSMPSISLQFGDAYILLSPAEAEAE